MTPRVALLDSGGANLGSVVAAFDRLGVKAPVTADWNTIRNATHVVLPGVGAARACMAKLRENGLDRVVKGLKQPLIGICVGMQLLFEHSEEGDTECLGLLPGSVRLLKGGPGLRIPHMGWNRLELSDAGRGHPLTRDMSGRYAYFVHSYAATPSCDTLATADHGEVMNAIVANPFAPIMGAQFHPERSSATGAQLLKNFLAIE